MTVINVEKRRDVSGQFRWNFKDESIQETYWIYLDGNDNDMVSVIGQAQATNQGFTNPLPYRGAPYPSPYGFGINVDSYSFRTLDDSRSIIECSVTYTTVKGGEERESNYTNPLQAPTEFGISWIEEERVIERGYNKEPLGPGGHRKANTLGPIVNGALQEFDEPLVDTVRHPVLVIKYNVSAAAGLSEVVAINEQFQWTTNSDRFLGADPYRCKFLAADTPGKEVANGVAYFPITVTIAFLKSTDKILNNVGWNERMRVDPANPATGLQVIKVRDPDSGEMVRPSEPVFLSLDGWKAPDKETPTITYRYLEPKPYASFLQQGGQ